ncbi:MAG: TIGR02677 family protein [Firmicutes bacterium]|nr:TIGR02677 family protein [Bacillota bacterium]
MNDKLLRPITEASYLTTGNAWRYRSILRYFYIQHERLRHYLFPDEVQEYLSQNPHFRDYTEEQLQQDLSQLVEWKNLIPRQDTGKVSSIQEFKKKKFRYQCTPYTIEIERMVQGLERMGESFGGSLERTLFDRLLESLMKLVSYPDSNLSNEELYVLWDDLYGNFRKLTENATDYLAHLQSEKIEEMMMTEAFLIYKDAITEYLRNFMTVLQRTSFRIEAVLGDVSSGLVDQIAASLAEYYLSIPRLDEQPSKEELEERYRQQWHSMKSWFLGRDGRESDLLYLQNATTETIRRMTRFAQRIGERHHNFKSRRQDYLHLAEWFYKVNDIKEAHNLSACVFGVFHTRHIYASSKVTEDIYAELWHEPPTQLTVKPRVRNYREKTKPGAVVSHKKEKEQQLEEFLRQKEAEQKLVERLISNNRIVIGKLPEVDPYVRKTLLYWISKCMSSSGWTAKTETGRKFKLTRLDDREVTLKSEDGILQMPNYVLKFLS